MPKYRTYGGLTRETAYLYDDEDGALEERAKKERCSKSEVIRRALRRYLGIEGADGSGQAALRAVLENRKP
jgi:Arc/MetJ-type ribon-helix-helix transcriptional regulator